MPTFLHHLRPGAAPLVSVVAGLSLFVLEGRQFNSNSSLLVGMLVAVAVAEVLPLASLGFVGGLLIAQIVGVLPSALAVGISSYLIIPVVIFFATVGRGPGRRGGQAPFGFAIALAGLVTTSWFLDSTWINYLFGTGSHSDGAAQNVLHLFLIAGAFCTLHLTAWAAGTAVTAASASSRAQADAEARLREAELDLALEQERNRIALELHDVLAHSLAVIIAQADGIRYVHRTEPESVEGSASVIAEAARGALLETRALLENMAPQDAGLQAPHPDRILALVERLGASGMPVTIESDGEPQQLGVGLTLTHHRILQEALTNVFKHGSRERGAHVALTWANDALTTIVTSFLTPGPAHKPSTQIPSSGRGVRGMKHRAETAGGCLEVSRDQETFTVRAVLPLPAQEPHLTPAFTRSVGMQQDSVELGGPVESVVAR